VATFHSFWVEEEYLKIINMERFSTALSALGWSYSNLLYMHVDQVVTPTQVVKDKLLEQGVTNVPIEVISNGVDTTLKDAKPFPKKLPEKYFIYAGRLSAEKSIEIVLQAFKNFTQKNSDIDLVMAGGGPLAKTLPDMVKELDITDRVHFLGELTHEEVVETTLLKNAIASVTASKSETQGLSTLEAMVWGTPVILPRANALAEVGDENCIMCEPDNVAQFTEAYLKMTDPKVREHYSKRALEFVKGHSLEKTADKLEHLYKEVIKRKSAASYKS
jgi:1,2-diacylglycerol 3-alpha-glucosyltransferase